MAQQVSIDPHARADDPKADDARADNTHEIAPDLAYRRLGIVNCVFVGSPVAGDRGWVLIDTGITGTKGLITRAAAERFGDGARPAAIILTHAHFDHVNALDEFAREWDAPVYAHGLEQPYLNGSASYPPPDPMVGGGLMALTSPLLPRGPFTVPAEYLRELPTDGSVPHMSGWKWLPTPGHSAGHVSFWRERDRSLIVGDAFVTTAQESVYAALTQEPEVHGPPMYYTHDWEAARSSVSLLAELRPELAVTGHGRPMQGPALREALDRLAREFDEIAMPKDTKYVRHPARPQDGSAYCAP
jgi:glyoxylase-like metal-dependent hydrolase (beta-lactamase superfamily II)